MSTAPEGNGSNGASGDNAEELPRIDFSTFLLSLYSSALVHLGDAPDPSDGKCCANLTMARQTIDLMAVLQEKTKGNKVMFYSLMIGLAVAVLLVAVLLYLKV